MARRLCAAALALALALALCGCVPLAAQNVNELLHAPALAPGQDEIQKALVGYLGLEPQYKYPKRGDWLSPLMRADLNGDGLEEAVLLYSVADNVTAARDKGINVYVAVLEYAEGAWVVCQDVQGLSTDVASLQVADLLGDGTRQLLIGFATSTFNAQTLALYTYDAAALTLVYSADYSRYVIGDFTGRGGSDLVVVSSEESPGKLQLQYIPTENGRFVLENAPDMVALDENFSSCAAIAPGVDHEGNRLLVVDGMTKTSTLSSQLVYYNGERFFTTDQVALRGATARANPLLLSRDIDGDGVVEIPVRYGNKIATIRGDKDLEIVEWMDFSGPEGEAPAVKQFGLLDSDRELFVRLPESWRSSIRVADGAAAGEWQMQDSKSQAPLISMRNLSGAGLPAGALQATTGSYLEFHTGISAADCEAIQLTSLAA